MLKFFFLSTHSKHRLKQFQKVHPAPMFIKTFTKAENSGKN